MKNHNAQPTPPTPSTEETQLHLLQQLSLNDVPSSAITQSINRQCFSKICKQRVIEKEKRSTMNGKERVRVNNRKKIDYLERRIRELEKQLSIIKRKYECCPNCRQNISEGPFENEIMIRREEYLSNVAGSDEKRCSKESLEFQNIDFTNPINFNPQMEEKNWIFIGTLMIVMGSKNLDVDGTVNTFKIIKQAVDHVRRQVQKSEPKIHLDFYHLKTDIQEPQLIPGVGFDPFYTKYEPIGSLELDGVRIQSVEEYDLFYDRKISFSVKYEALITAMQYIKEHCWFH